METTLILKFSQKEVIIKNPSFIPAMETRVTTKDLPLSRVYDIHHSFTDNEQIITVLLMVYEETGAKGFS